MRPAAAAVLWALAAAQVPSSSGQAEGDGDGGGGSRAGGEGGAAALSQQPNSAALTLLTAAASATGARCLDGSPAAYYYRPFRAAANATKWIVFIKGGGWCTSIADCYGRSLTELGSSRSYPPTRDLAKEDGLLSNDPRSNPMAADWNHVYLQYCDGASFTGSNQTTETYNGTAILADLMARHSLGKATDLVLTGCSAGGLATYLHADYVAALVPNATVVAAPDSGFFLDRDFPEHGFHYHSDLVWVFEQQNSTSGTDQDCIAAQGESNSTWKCIFAEHVAPFVKTPLFPLQSQYDSWQVRFILGNDSEPLVNDYGKDFSATFIKALALNDTQGVRLDGTTKFNGAFLDSCFHHCKEWDDISIRNSTSSQALMAFYEGVVARRSESLCESQYFYFQNEPYKCDSCCHSSEALN